MANTRKKDGEGSSGPGAGRAGKGGGRLVVSAGQALGTVRKLDNAFYERPGVVSVARDLLGKVLVTEFGGQRTSGRIVEVEAYNGVGDRASHAWSGRRRGRTEVIFGPSGVAYVYLIYGIHHLFNVVTNKRDVPHAVLVRALEPVE